MTRITEKLLVFTGKHPRRCAAAALLLGLLAAAGLCRVSFTNDVSQLFPDTPESRSTFRVLHETRLADTVQLEFIADAAPVSRHEARLDQIARDLGKVPGVRNVVFRYRSGSLLAEAEGFSALIPRFFSPEVLKRCDPAAAARNALSQLAFPAPGGARLLRTQPFGIERGMLLELKKLDETAGFLADPSFPYFVSRDRRRAMILFETDIELGDADAVRKLFAAVREVAAPLPDGMTMRIVSGCNHTLGNEETLKRDATVAGAVSLVFFLAIFCVFYRRDRRALWIPAIPLYASLLALGVMTIFFREICLYVIGLGSCITGLAVDQGIHVYAAYRGADAEKRVAALTRPMLLSAATSILVFLFLGLTGIRAHLQLAVFAGTSLALSCFISLALLPHLLDRDPPALAELPLPATRRKLPAWSCFALVIGLAPAFAAGIPLLLRDADFSLTALDGTPAETLREEAEFRAAWRKAGPSTAVLAAVGKTGDEALTRLRTITARLEALGVDVAAPPVPPVSEQRRNRETWRSAECRRAIADLETRTREACRHAGLPAAFFDPFFRNLRAGIDAEGFDLPPMLDLIARRMVRGDTGSASAVALLVDSPANARAAREALREENFRDCALLSKEAFHTLIREELGGRFRRLFALSFVSALALAAAVFRKPVDLLLAMTPVLFSFAVLAVLGGLTGFHATPAAAFALILLTGLAVDYGIYAVCQRRDPASLEVRTPVLLSALTTIAGAGALVLSKHPALFGTGAVLAPGIAAACLCGVWLATPSRSGKSGAKTKKNSRMLALFLAIAAALLAGGCASGKVTDPAEESRIREKLRIYPDAPFTVQAVAVLEAPGHAFTFLLAAEFDPAAETFRAAAVNPGSGTLLFRLARGGDGAPPPPLPPELPDDLARVARALPDDLKWIFLHKNPAPLAVTQKKEYIAVCSTDGVETRIHPWGWERRRTAWFLPSRQCEFRDGGRNVIYRIAERGCTLRLTIRQLKRREK